MIIIGDVHGKIANYNNKVKDHDLSLCLGDVGFDYSELTLDPEHHKILAGNHENYSSLTPHFLGDYGVWQDIFYIRGAYSIDRHYRKSYIDWFPQEEVSYNELNKCITLFNEVKPEIVVSHDCPSELKEILINHPPRDRTSFALQIMFEQYQPKRWFFGHHHLSITTKINKTLFTCLNELETYILKNNE